MIFILLIQLPTTAEFDAKGNFVLVLKIQEEFTPGQNSTCKKSYTKDRIYEIYVSNMKYIINAWRILYKAENTFQRV